MCAKRLWDSNLLAVQCRGQGRSSSGCLVVGQVVVEMTGDHLPQDCLSVRSSPGAGCGPGLGHLEGAPLEQVAVQA